LCMSSFVSYALEIGDKLPPRIPNVNYTEGYETISIKVVYRMDGSVSGAQAKTCMSCPIETYTNKGEATFYVGRRLLSMKQLSGYNGKSGTVIYEPKTKKLVSIHFFDLEK
jgi:hypothetical protein